MTINPHRTVVGTGENKGGCRMSVLRKLDVDTVARQVAELVAWLPWL
jgi:hypothetical protein